MMKDYAILLRAMFVQMFRAGLDKTEKRKKYWMYGIVCVCMLPLVVLICYSIYNIGAAMVQLQIFDYFLSILMLMSVMMVFVFGTVSFLSITFYSKDNETVLNLPVKTSVVFLARFTMVYLSEIVLSAIFLLPTLITAGVAGINAGLALNAGYFIGVLFSVVFLPVIPLLLIALISFPLVYVVSFFKRNSFLSGILMIICFFGLFGGFYYLMFSSGGPAGGDIQSILAGVVDQLKFAGTVSYPTLVYARMITGVNAGANFGIFFGILIGCFIVVVGLSILTFKRGLRMNIESGGVSKKRHAASDDKQSSGFGALVRRELKDLTKNPVLMFQSFMNVIMPAFMIVIFLMLGMFDINVEQNGTPVKFNPQMQAMAIALLFGTMMLCGMNYTALIAVSREGESFSVLKSLPVSPKNAIKAKLLIADGNVFIGDLLLTIVIGVVTKQNALNAVLYFLIILGFGMSINAYGIYRDLKAPKLNWQSIKEITNRNFNVMIPMFISMGAGLALMISAILAAAGKIPSLAGWAIIWSLGAVIDAVFYIVFRKKLFDNLERLYYSIEC